MTLRVIDALRRFLPEVDAGKLDVPRRRAVWAMTHCRTAEMGGHLHACPDCGATEYAYHSCNHRSCPLCGAQDNAEWVERELEKRVGAPYFMVTFTLPSELRCLFRGAQAKQAYDLFFQAASSTLKDILANPKGLGAKKSGFTLILHTWNQRMGMHPHLHGIVPGAGLDASGRVVTVKHPEFLAPQKALRQVFRARFRDGLKTTGITCEIDPAVWQKSWGVHLQPFGSGENAIKYLGRYVCHPVIGDSRIKEIGPDKVTFQWTDRAHGNLKRQDTIPGLEFTRRFLSHVLPKGLRSIRYYGFCHPSSKKTRERIALHTGCRLQIGVPRPKPVRPARKCRHCDATMQAYRILTPRCLPEPSLGDGQGKQCTRDPP